MGKQDQGTRSVQKRATDQEIEPAPQSPHVRGLFLGLTVRLYSVS